MREIRSPIYPSTGSLAEDVATRFEGSIRLAWQRALAQAQQRVSDYEAINGLINWREFERHMGASLLPWLAAVTHKSASRHADSFSADSFPGIRKALPFFITNQEAIAWAERWVGRLITGISDESRRAIRIIVLGTLEGRYDPAEAARRIKLAIGLTERQANAIETLRLQLEEQVRAEKITALQANTQLEAQRVRSLAQRAEAIARTECLPGDTVVDAAVVRAAHRRWYTGELAEITTRGGRKFSATPNHPVLTQRGWVGAGLLNEGDHLVCRARQQNGVASSDPDVAQPPTTISQITRAIEAVGIRERRRTTIPDFHGDGMNGEVDAFLAYGELAFGRFSPIYKPLVKNILTEANETTAPLCVSCGRLLSIDKQECLCGGPASNTTVAEATSHEIIGYVEATTDGLYALSAHVGVTNLADGNIRAVVGGMAAAREELAPRVAQASRDTCLTNDLRDPLGGSSHGEGSGTSTQSALVELDRVVSIGLRPWSGHVYNLTTPFGYFVANEIYTGNTMSAANAGQQLLWEKGQREGYIPFHVKRILIVTPDEKLCLQCQSIARAGPVGLHEPFIDHAGDAHQQPPIHTSCRCAMGIIWPDEVRAA